MKTLTVLTSLLVFSLAASAAHAQTAPVANPGASNTAASSDPRNTPPNVKNLTEAEAAATAGPDPLAGLTMYERPQDFPSLQQLAIQDRVERIQALQDTILCLQQAITTDDIYVCRMKETKAVNRVRYTYCAAGVATPKRVTGRNTLIQDDDIRSNGCLKAMNALSGQRQQNGLKKIERIQKRKQNFIDQTSGAAAPDADSAAAPDGSQPAQAVPTH